MKEGEIVQVIDIHSDLYLKIGEVIEKQEDTLLIYFDMALTRDCKQLNEAVADFLEKGQVVKAWWKTA